MSKTIIYPDYSSFLARTEKTLNGVSTEHAKENPNYEIENTINNGCWNCYDCSDCSDCYGCYGCYDCYDCSDCSDCYGCYGCYDCYDCYDCSGCKDKRNQKSDKAAETSWFDIPKIENVHATILSAASAPDALNMGDWHTCDTTHCRAGWVVHKAGKKGYALEKASSTLFAAMQIYKASSPVRVAPVRFFEKNEVAMTDMQRCAAEEAKLSK